MVFSISEICLPQRPSHVLGLHQSTAGCTGSAQTGRPGSHEQSAGSPSHPAQRLPTRRRRCCAGAAGAMPSARPSTRSWEHPGCRQSQLMRWQQSPHGVGGTVACLCSPSCMAGWRAAGHLCSVASQSLRLTEREPAAPSCLDTRCVAGVAISANPRRTAARGGRRRPGAGRTRVELGLTQGADITAGSALWSPAAGGDPPLPFPAPPLSSSPTHH